MNFIDKKGEFIVEEKFIFRGEKINYNKGWIDDDTYIFQFGENKLKDNSGDNCFILVEYHKSNGKYIIQCWYDDEIVAIYSEYSDKDTNKEIFQLTFSEIQNIKLFMKKVM